MNDDRDRWTEDDMAIFQRNLERRLRAFVGQTLTPELQTRVTTMILNMTKDYFHQDDGEVDF
jgi:hypothetical protein